MSTSEAIAEKPIETVTTKFIVTRTVTKTYRTTITVDSPIGHRALPYAKRAVKEKTVIVWTLENETTVNNFDEVE